ncbi:hypothetical protein HOP52_19245 [Halomonas campisalis]|uniref:Uncharacterized protein n=1 Tax=Billgrantia campisalis TaxID=74661 RepID=A0ABS9PDM7_9GAMM|nr:hypothetical protein [Halomonas campisalis]MCG6659882.1 hypothetical protein [Halomonas campisalis]MDR5865080.1 hypothetical protein [Halomonas campisalis]
MAISKLILGKRDFWLPLTVKQVAENPADGEFCFSLRVRDVSSRRLCELLRELSAIQVSAEFDDDEREVRIAEKLGELVMGWRDVCDDGGEEIPFTPEAFRQLLKISGMAPAILRAYGDGYSTAVPTMHLKA